MYKRLSLIIFAALSVFLTSCVDEEEFADNNTGNFEALWKILDQHYCFFSQKHEALGVDWNEVHQRYASQVSSTMTKMQLFEHCANMLAELRDGHVNLSSSWDYGREWSWKEDYPTNFSDTLQRRYLGTDYKMANGFTYRILDDNIGYLYLSSFSGTIGNGNLDNILYYLAPCNALIVDIRNNGGGMLTSAETLAQRFLNEEMEVGFIQHKTGKGHNDFSEPKVQKLKPADGVRWQKNVVVLTNRSVFSAANEFVKYMKTIGTKTHRITIVGDNTGGGAGMPFTSELPNGWSVRFSACPMYDVHGNCTEQGIEPDHRVGLSDADFHNGRDTMIEYARTLCNAF